ncbi:MAG: hypothetical protein ABSC71_12210 [Candidatus Acidiferrales bacterium]|jgi:hypothetical protein
MIELAADTNAPWGASGDPGRPIRNIVASAMKAKIIILTQSCDLDRTNAVAGESSIDIGTRSFVMYCPIIPVNELIENRDRLEHIRKNQLLYLHWLPEFRTQGVEIAESVVCFPLISTILKASQPNETFDLRTRIASLTSPYRESVASRFAHFIARITGDLAYPVDSSHATGSSVQESGEYQIDRL